MNKPLKKSRPKIKQVTKIRSILQKEVNSICPLCNNRDVEHFQIHHIDENPEHNHIENLLLVCPTCHSKITKGDLNRELVQRTKLDLPSRHQIECASISIDHDKCSWKNYDDYQYAFIDDENDKNPNPVVVFSLINHSSKTILLKEINLEVVHLYNGLSGLPEDTDFLPADLAQPKFLRSMTLFEMELPEEDTIGKFKLREEIEVPAGRAFKFDIQIYERFSNANTQITGRKHLLFSFKFNSNIVLNIPTIFLNCKPNEDGVKMLQLA